MKKIQITGDFNRLRNKVGNSVEIHPLFFIKQK